MPERHRLVLQSRFAFTEQHLSITLDLTPGLEKVATECEWLHIMQPYQLPELMQPHTLALRQYLVV